MKIKHVYNSMASNILKTILFFLIIIIASFNILKSTAYFKYYDNEYKSVEDVLNNKMFKISTLNAGELLNSYFNEEVCKETLEFLNNNNIVYYFSKQDIYLMDFDESDNMNLIASEYNENKYLLDTVYVANASFFDKNEISLESGAIFSKEDLNFKTNKYESDNLVPILMGNNYKEYFDIGDEVVIANPVEKSIGKVIGFLKENTYVKTYDGINTEMNIDNIIIAPFEIRNSYNDILKSILWGSGIFIMDSNMTIEEVNTRLNDISEYILENLGVKAGLYDISSTLNEENQYKLSILFIKLSSIIIVCILSILTLVILSLMSLEKRRKEFAIHILSGADKLDLYRGVFIEQAILIIVPYISCWLYLNNIEGIKLSLHVTLISLIFISMILIFIVFISIRKIQTMSVSSLIKGDE